MTQGITKRQLFALACGVTIGYISIDISPLLLGAVSDGLSIGRARAGLLTSLEVSCFGLTMLLLAPLTPRLPQRRTAIAATILLMIAHFLSGLSTTFNGLVIFRTLAGIAEGILLAVVYAAIAGVPQSERVYARCISIMVIIAGALYFVVPTLTDMFSYRGAYGLAGLVALFLLPFLHWLGRRNRLKLYPLQH
jgi:predicted MFS family arabinose efflux permease